MMEKKKEWLAENPLFQSLNKHAQELWSRCNVCDIKDSCDRFKEDSSCTIEKDLFEDVIGGLIVENRLDTTIDHMMAFDTTIKFVQLIKTLLYERKYGMIRANQDGIITLRMRLSTQIMQLAKILAIDRNSRFVIKFDGGSNKLAGTDLSQLLSNMDEHITVESVTATKIVKGPPVPRSTKFIDIDGKEIEQGDVSVGFD